MLNFTISNVKSQSLYSAKYSKIGPLFSNDLRILNYDTTVDIIFACNDIRVSKKIYPYQLIEDGKIIKTENIARFFVFQKDSIYGYVYDTTIGIINSRQHIDTATGLNVILNNAIENDFNKFLPKKIKFFKDSINSNYKEIYEIKIEEDSTIKLIWELTFNEKYKNYPQSISKYMDSLSKSKLVEIKSYNPSRYLKQYNLTMDAFEFIYKMEFVEIEDKTEIFRLIDLYCKINGINYSGF
jgi:hypothetical protein